MTKSYYVVPFKTLLQQNDISDSENSITLSRDQLRHLFQRFLAYVPVDEAWYMSTYPDIAEAIEAGVTKSARDHFVMDGYFEGRKPGPVVVDTEFYLAKYADVAEGIEYGDIESAQAHFEQHGFTEGRLPHSV
jgi:hypothetical protein